MSQFYLWNARHINQYDKPSLRKKLRSDLLISSATFLVVEEISVSTHSGRFSDKGSPLSVGQLTQISRCTIYLITNLFFLLKKDAVAELLNNVTHPTPDLQGPTVEDIEPRRFLKAERRDTEVK